MNNPVSKSRLWPSLPCAALNLLNVEQPEAVPRLLIMRVGANRFTVPVLQHFNF